MTDREDELLALHRQDARTALLLHTLLVVVLSVLWIADRRFGALGPLKHWILDRLQGAA